jgi:hypothetical protein
MFLAYEEVGNKFDDTRDASGTADYVNPEIVRLPVRVILVLTPGRRRCIYAKVHISTNICAN